jgi:excisionase family DNA binding protein
MRSPSQAPLSRVAAVLARRNQIHLGDASGERIPLPDTLIGHIARLVDLLSTGRELSLRPDGEALTTQAAAEYLGVSRQHLVGLVDRGEIPHHRVGSHRRIGMADLLAFAERRDVARRKALDQIATEIERRGLHTPEVNEDKVG